MELLKSNPYFRDYLEEFLNPRQVSPSRVSVHGTFVHAEGNSEAEYLYAQILLELKKNPQRSPLEEKPKTELTFETFYKEHYLEWCKNRQAYYYSLKKYLLNRIPDWFRKLKLSEIGVRELELLQTQLLNEGKSIATCNRYLSVIKASFTKAYEWDFIPEERLKTIRKVKNLKGEVKRLRYLTEEEIKALLANCEPHLYPIVFTALNTGMRKSEILGLKWSNVDLKNDLILLEKTKNGERREIPINKALKKVLLGLFVDRRLDTDYVFVNPATRKRYNDIKRSFNTACKKAGIKDFRFHDLRHTFASHLVMNGVDLKTVQELLGHKKLSMTLRYAHLSQAHKREAVKTIEKVVSEDIYHNFITI